jgi:ribosomal protein S18 acetylase RimI-like enzyme
MSPPAIQMHHNRSGTAEVAAHLRTCDASFIPLLSQSVDLDTYAAKIVARADRFEAWTDGRLAGLVAAYCNDPALRVCFVTSVSVVPDCQGHGIASRLLGACVAYARRAGFKHVELEVDGHNTAAAGLYRKQGFAAVGMRDDSLILQLAFEGAPE